MYTHITSYMISLSLYIYHHVERLVEYDWNPHRDVLANKGLPRASIYWYMC